MGSFGRLAVLASLLALLASLPAFARGTPKEPALDGQVRAFLAERQSRWRDMNVPTRDGEFLHDLIVEHGYQRALEIGTSTGHSGIWIALALSKTGGKLVTIEIDPGRHREALANFEKAGVSRFIDARLADAHQLVKQLEGPFDFVFSDADKGWNKQYFVDLAPKMVPGGCYTTHNVGMRGGWLSPSTREYVDYLRSQRDFETTIENTRTSGIAVTCRKRD